LVSFFYWAAVTNVSGVGLFSFCVANSNGRLGRLKLQHPRGRGMPNELREKKKKKKGKLGQ